MYCFFIVPHVDIELADNKQFISNIPRIWQNDIRTILVCYAIHTREDATYSNKILIKFETLLCNTCYIFYHSEINFHKQVSDIIGIYFYKISFKRSRSPVYTWSFQHFQAKQCNIGAYSKSQYNAAINWFWYLCLAMTSSPGGCITKACLYNFDPLNLTVI